MGRIPNATADLARPRERKGGKVKPITYGVRKGVTIPMPDPDWHPIATMVWNSLELSGQADFFQQSDWAMAYSICDDLHHYKMPLIDRNGEPYYKRSGQMLQTINTSLASLLMTEGDRRRVQMELVAPEPESTPAAVLQMQKYRDDLEKTQTQT